MKKMPVLLFALCLLLATSLLLPACKVKEGQLPTIKAGDRWVWSYAMEGATYTFAEEVTGEETIEGRDCYVIDMSLDPVMTTTQNGTVYTTTSMKYWMDKATGLYGVKHEYATTYNGQAVTSSMIYSYSPWASLFPLEIGKEVETERTTTHYLEGEPYGDTEVDTVKHVVVSKEDVTVTAGTFSCWKITYYDTASDITQTMWWSDEAKMMVKSIDEYGNTMMELLSYSVS